jgi:TolB-like protein
MGQAGSGIYEFEGLRLAAGRRLLSHADGRPIELPPKAFDALLYMVRHPGELLDKAVLLKAVWPNVVVEENNLNQVISALRRALGNGAESRIIVTVPGRGYQFVAAVNEAGADVPPRIDAAQGSAAPSTSPARDASIAVLPFASLSSDPEKDYFGDGIADELIHLLARVPGLKVPARTSSFAYKGRNKDARRIARDLGVAMLLEGSVRSAGERIRVTAQLIEADTGFHIWSQAYERQFSDVFELQDELAGAIVQALKINLGERAIAQQETPPTKNLEAYRLFMQVRAMWDRALVPVSNERMQELLNRIVALDPSFARAHAALSSIQGMQFNLGAGPEILARVQQSAERALELDPHVASAHQSFGGLHSTRGEWLAADASLRRAIDLDPGEPNALTTYAVMVLAPTGRLKKALELARAAYRLAPAFTANAITLAGMNELVGRDEEAAEYIQIAVDLGFPKLQAPLAIFRSQLARRAGRYDEARDIMLAVVPPGLRTQGGDGVVQRVYAALADAHQAPAAVSALRSLVKSGDPKLMDSGQMTILTLNWYAMLGALDDAYDTAQRIVQRFRQTGVLASVHLGALWLPEHRAFRRDPRFAGIVAALGLNDYWKEHGPPDNCEFRDGRLIVN